MSDHEITNHFVKPFNLHQNLAREKAFAAPTPGLALDLNGVGMFRSFRPSKRTSQRHAMQFDERPTQTTKAVLRQMVLATRDGLPAETRIEASLAVAERARDLVIAPGTIVSGFSPIRSEIDVRPLLAHLRDEGARLCLPAILDRQTIVFRELVRGAPVVDTGFGTIGPDETAAVLDPELMLVPLAAFDAAGHRIGYGAGHYDRAIARLRQAGRHPRVVGVAFAMQEVAVVPAEGHDEPLDAILTETGLRSFAPAL
jgi:5-formyltetrahydrofolate cyclo-ligase